MREMTQRSIVNPCYYTGSLNLLNLRSPPVRAILTTQRDGSLQREQKRWRDFFPKIR
jgi:hypothetical protein